MLEYIVYCLFDFLLGSGHIKSTCALLYVKMKHSKSVSQLSLCCWTNRIHTIDHKSINRKHYSQFCIIIGLALKGVVFLRHVMDVRVPDL